MSTLTTEAVRFFLLKKGASPKLCDRHSGRFLPDVQDVSLKRRLAGQLD